MLSRKSRPPCALIAVALWPMWVLGQTPSEPTMELSRSDSPETPPCPQEITFCTVGEKELKLDLALPRKGNGPYPAVICFHGGAWVSGTRKTLAIIHRLADQGFVALRADYRFAPRYKFPAQIHDAKRVVRWVRANAKKYDVDPDRVGVIGYSAGGHLASLLATTNGNPEYEGDTGDAAFSSEVQVVVSYYGVSNMEELYRYNVTRKESPLEVKLATRFALPALLEGTPDEAPDRYREAGPIHLVSVKTAPMLLIHGMKDRMVPYSQSIDFHRELQAAGSDARMLLLGDIGHGFGDHVGGYSGQVADFAALQFLSQHLHPPRDDAE